MNIGDHNKLIKIVFDGSKHLKHVMTSDEIKRMTLIENKYPLSRLPVCGHCEKLAYWHHHGQAYCPSCGSYTKAPITYSSYLSSGYDIDETGNTARTVLQQERNKRCVVLPDFGE